MRTFLILLTFTISFALNIPSNFKANFIQTIKSDNQKIEYKGEIFYKNGKILWKYTYPTEKYIWIGKKVYIYEPDLYQVTITKRPKFNLENILKNAKKINSHTYKTTINNTKVTFIYDKFLQKLSYKDKVGNRVEIVFSNYSTKELNNSLFTPNFPKDVDIIYQNTY